MFEALKKCIAKKEKIVFIRSLGYKKTEKGLRTLEAFLKAGSLYEWIKTGHFDFRYSAEEFLLAVAKACGFDEGAFAQEIEKAKERQIEISKLQTPYIFVDTNFKRVSQPIFALAVSEGLRRLILDKEELYDLSKEERLSKVSEIVASHYKESGGEIGIWGKIAAYNFHDIDGKAYIFDPDGKLREEDAKVSESVATLSL